MDKEKEYNDIEVMTKEEAIKEMKSFFKGNKKFIDQATLLIYSSHDFIKINRIALQKNTWNWEKLHSISIDTKMGFKLLHYRKGNKEYSPANINHPTLEGNTTHDIDEWTIRIYERETMKTVEYIL